MPGSHHPEATKAEAKKLCETTAMTYAEIGAALGGVPGPTVGAWKRREGWARPPDAIHRKPIPKEKRDVAALLRRAGVPHDQVAVLVECHPETARRLGRKAREGAAGPSAALAPELVAALREALASGGSGRRELVRLAERALAVAAADALADRDLPPDRRARTMALIVASIRALPDDAPAAGVLSHDPDTPGPASVDENDVLEELARRIEALGERREDDGAPGVSAAGSAIAAQ